MGACSARRSPERPWRAAADRRSSGTALTCDTELASARTASNEAVAEFDGATPSSATQRHASAPLTGGGADVRTPPQACGAPLFGEMGVDSGDGGLDDGELRLPEGELREVDRDHGFGILGATLLRAGPHRGELLIHSAAQVVPLLTITAAYTGLRWG